MSVLVGAVGDASVSALAFGDAADGHEALHGLAQFPDVDAAALYDHDGHLFATYDKQTEPPRVWAPSIAADAPPHREIDNHQTRVRTRIVHDGQTYGTIAMIASNDALEHEIESFLVTITALVLALIAASIAAAWLLQRGITRPVLQLAAIARRITQGEATTLRAPATQPGELGTLAAGFNAMLDNLAAREHEVVTSRDTLRAVIDASPVAIIACDAAGVVTLWNAQAKVMFGADEPDAVGHALAKVAPDPALAEVWARATTEAMSAL
jgi:methyl-accepting chemotaxis protein